MNYEDEREFLEGIPGDENIMLVLTEDENEDGVIRIPPAFQQLHHVHQADLVRDYIEQLTEMYESILSGDFDKDMNAIMIVPESVN